jgi:hypothetical protein
VKNGERAGKLDCWTRMPVHPEFAIRGGQSMRGETVKHNVQEGGCGYPARQNTAG